MMTFPYFNADDRLAAFEISNILCSRKKATRIACSVDGACLVRKPQRPFSLHSEEVFCELKLDGYQIEISEPFGDNSRYLVFSDQPGSEVALKKLQYAFSQA